MRVQSVRPCANGGYLHPIGQKVNIAHVKEQEPKTIDTQAIMREISSKEWPSLQGRFAASLGVSLASLASIGCAWSVAHHAFAFPMMDGLGHCVGIRLRTESGRKFAVNGSRHGLFLPDCNPQTTVYLVEGPTDLAATLTLGLFAIGEPSCNACINYTQVAINRLGIRKAVIVADNDAVGIRGAKRLASELQIPCCTLVLPCKDIRDFLNLGGTKALIESLTSSLVWQQPNHKPNQNRTSNATT